MGLATGTALVMALATAMVLEKGMAFLRAAVWQCLLYWRQAPLLMVP
jgi:hypothetical protein